jgi:hypothetical protein
MKRHSKVRPTNRKEKRPAPKLTPRDPPGPTGELREEISLLFKINSLLPNFRKFRKKHRWLLRFLSSDT